MNRSFRALFSDIAHRGGEALNAEARANDPNLDRMMRDRESRRYCENSLGYSAAAADRHSSFQFVILSFFLQPLPFPPRI